MSTSKDPTAKAERSEPKETLDSKAARASEYWLNVFYANLLADHISTGQKIIHFLSGCSGFFSDMFPPHEGKYNQKRYQSKKDRSNNLQL
jgi:hypothetical protein